MRIIFVPFPLLSLHITLLTRSNHRAASCINLYFLWSSSILLCICTIMSLFSYLFLVSWIISRFNLLWIVLQSTNETLRLISKSRIPGLSKSPIANILVQLIFIIMPETLSYWELIMSYVCITTLFLEPHIYTIHFPTFRPPICILNHHWESVILKSD